MPIKTQPIWIYILGWNDNWLKIDTFVWSRSWWELLGNNDVAGWTMTMKRRHLFHAVFVDEFYDPLFLEVARKKVAETWIKNRYFFLTWEMPKFKYVTCKFVWTTLINLQNSEKKLKKKNKFLLYSTTSSFHGSDSKVT